MSDEPRNPARRGSRATRVLLAVVTVILAFWALRAMQPVAVTVAFALFVAVLLRPIDRRIGERLPPRFAWVGRVAAALVLLGVLALVAGGLLYVAREIAGAMPRVADRLSEVLPPGLAEGGGAASSEGGAGLLDTVRPMLRSAGGSVAGWAVETATSLAQAVVNTTGALAAFVVIVFFLVLLALGEAPLWRGKLDTLLAGRGAEASAAVHAIAERLRLFLLMRVLMGVLSAALYVGWLAFFGLDLLPVWAVLTFFLAFVPNIGSVVSGILPVLYAFLVLDPWTALAIGAGLFAIEQVIGNFVDPRLQGRQIALSPLVILVAVLFWGWLWGIAGAFLAVPLTSAILITCAQVPALRPVAILLGNAPDGERLDARLRD